ncbi:MAG: ankyrin repeat domain-containing protein [Candidatus Izemoplasmatales bacterium]
MNDLRKDNQPSVLIEKCKSLDYSRIHPFLIPFHLVIDLMDVFEQGMKDEAIVLDYFFGELHLNHYQETTIEEFTELIKNLPTSEKTYLLEHLPILRFPFPKYIYTFLSDEVQTVMPPDHLPEKIILYEWFQIMLKELYEEEPLENTEFIHDCLLHDHIHMFKAYIENGDIPLTLLTYRQESLLHEAVKFEATEIIKYLLNIGMSPDLTDFYGSTPIFIACAKGYTEGFKLLKSNHANLNKMNVEKIKPLEISVYSGKKEFIEFLIKDELYPANSLYNETTLSIAIHDGITGAIEYLLDEGYLSLDQKVNQFDTLFDIAIYERKPELLLSWSKRADFNFEKVNGQGVSLLEKMLMADLVEMIPWLEEHGLDLFKSGRNGKEPLVQCATYRAHRFFDYYVQKGMSIEGIEKQILEAASRASNAKVLRYLKEHQVDFNQLLAPRTSAFIYIGQQYSHELYMEFIDDIDILFHNESDIPLLIDPTYHNDFEVVRILLEKGADPNIPIRYESKRRYYPILNAIYHHHLEMVKLLVEYHAKKNISTERFLTPRLEALKRRSNGGEEVYQYLREIKAKPGPIPYLLVGSFFLIVFTIVFLSWLLF